MDRLSEQDRLKRLQELLTAWQSLLSKPPRDGAISDEQREQGLCDALIPVAAPEIYEGFVEDPVACVYCDLFSMDDAAAMKERVLAVIPKGMKRAGHTYTKKHAGGVGEHVKNCIAAELADLRDSLRAEAQKKGSRAFLPALLDWPRFSAALLLEEMTFEQRNEVLELLFAHTGASVVALGDEPKDEALWRLWYAGALQVVDPKVQNVLEEEGRPAIVLLGEAWGTPLPPEKKPGGALYAKYYYQLARELSKGGHTIQDPASVSRIRAMGSLRRESRDIGDRRCLAGAGCFSQMQRGRGAR